MTTDAIDDARRWAARPVRAWLIRAAIFLLPILGSIAFVFLASRVIPAPSGGTTVFVAWFLAITASATLVLMGIDRMTRRLLPIAALYKLSLIFPDRVPSRFQLALKTGSVKDLAGELASARAARASDTPQAAAERLLGLVASLDLHDSLTRGHSDRVRAYTRMIAEQMKLPGADIEKLNWAALLHDIGKLEIPEEILQKQGKPSDEEFALLREHPERGMVIADSLCGWLGPWAYAIRDHHEWWDGGGYPAGAAGEDITLAGRIVAVADVFDVITSSRAYKEANDPVAGRAEMARCAGSQFDPAVVRAFLEVSLGRLRLVMGPLSWLGQIPVLGSAPVTPVVTTVSNAAVAVLAAAGLGLVSPSEAPAEPPAPEPAVEVAETELPAAPDTAAPEPEEPDVPEVEVAPGVAPDARDFSREVGEDNVLLVAQDEFPASAETIRVGLASGPGAGSARFDGNDTLIYRPPANFNGETSLAYEACGTGDTCATALLRVSVLPLNDPPVAADDEITVLRGRAAFVDVLANDSDVDGDDLTVAEVGTPTVGRASTNGGGVLWTPPDDFVGQATVGYTAADDAGVDASAELRVTVVEANAPPTFTAGANQSVPEDSGPREVDDWARDIGPGAVGEADQVVRFSVDADDPALFSAQPAVAPNGTLTYTPAPDANGQTAVSVRAVDDGGDDDTSAPQTFTITVRPVNDPPRFTPGADQTVTEDPGAVSIGGWATGISAGESGQSVSFAVTSDNPGLFSTAPAVDAAGRLSYTPAANASGEATVAVVARDDGGTKDGGRDVTPGRTFTITVTPVNDPPVGADDSVALNEDQAGGTTFNVLGNDSDIDSGSISIASTDASGISNGTLTAGGVGVYTYVPDPDYNGTESFRYVVSDGDGGTDPATVTITTNAQADPPVATGESYSVVGGNTLTAGAPGLLANDSDVDGESLTVRTTPVAGPANGALTLNADGSFSYTPTLFYSGPDAFTYRIDDGTGRTDDATASITVTAPPASGTSLFLQPSGSSADDWDLLTTTAPDATPEPDHEGDANPGLTIKASDGDESNNDPLEYQLWTYDLPGPVRLDGPVTVKLWSSIESFDVGEDGHPYFYFYDCDAAGANCNLLLQFDDHTPNWNGGIADWGYREFVIGSVPDQSIAAGRTLQLRLLHEHEDLWVALSEDRPTELEITTR